MDKMGFEGILYYGAAGSTATNQLTNAKDITISGDVERGDTTRRGDSSGPPIKSGRVTARIVGIEFQMLNNTSDTYLEAMKVAAAAGTPVALRGKDYAAGKGPDGDFTLGVSKPWPLAGEQVVTITAEPTEESGRTVQPYV
jgi:hypothetical protein